MIQAGGVQVWGGPRRPGGGFRCGGGQWAMGKHFCNLSLGIEMEKAVPSLFKDFALLIFLNADILAKVCTTRNENRVEKILF